MVTPAETLDDRCERLAALGSSPGPAGGAVVALREALGDEASRVRVVAARALGAWLARGDAPREVAGDVARALAAAAVSDPHLWARHAAAAALARAPAEALEFLDGLCRRGPAEARERAVRAVGHWGRGGARAAARGDEDAPGGGTPTGPEAGAGDGDGDGPARAAAAEPTLAAALDDESPAVRAAAAQALGALPARGPAVAALAARARGDADPSARAAALAAIADAGVVDRDEAFAAVEVSLADALDEVSLAALEAVPLARRPDRAARLLPALRPLARDGARPKSVRVAALRALASFGGAAAAALDEVLAAATCAPWAVREQAVETFAALVVAADGPLDARLSALLASARAGERYLALRVLQGLGAPPAGLAAAVWNVALDDGDARARGLARDLAVRAPAADGAHLGRLASALAARRPSTRLRAAALGRALGPAASPLAPALVRALPDPSRKVRRAAAEALGGLGPAALPGVPATLRRAFEGERTVRRAARAALATLAPALAPGLRAPLARVLAGRDDEVESLLLGLLDAGLPGVRTDEIARAARSRARWYASLAGDAPAPGPNAPPEGLRAEVLADLAAAEAAGARRPRLDSGPGARGREAAWLLAHVTDALLARR